MIGMMTRKNTIWNSLFALVALFIMPSSAEVAGGSTSGCHRSCGDTELPYPFGLKVDGESCYRDRYFALTCNDSYIPPKLFNGNVELVSISPRTAKIVILLNVSSECYPGAQSSTWNTTLTPVFTFSDTDNVFTGVGCDTLAQIEGPSQQSFTGGCLSVCDSNSSIRDGECSGMGCCQAAVPRGLQRYLTSFGPNHNHSRLIGFNPCSYSFLVQKGNYSFRTADLGDMDRNRSFPVVLDWTVNYQLSCKQAVNNQTSYACISTNSVCVDSSTGRGYVCNCSKGFEGNPYIVDGCQDINECEHQETYPCKGKCINYPGGHNCTCFDGFTGDPQQSGCQRIASTSARFPVVIVIPVVATSSLLAVCLSIWIYSSVQKRKVNEIKERCFIQNGGRLLKMRTSSSKESEDVFKIFSKEEIERATNKYDQAYVLGRGGQGVVYKGILPNDSRTFAIKKSIVMDGSKIEEFINELVILSKVNHRNIVRLVGCCLEVQDPFLVYEFVENGTLSEHIKSGSLSWEVRLRIAAEAAGALAYLHSSANNPIIHRDVKSSNILLDKKYSAKVSDFGASKLVSIEEAQVQTIVMGTLGYLDPEYMLTHQLTEKSDVYSFGVVLLELLTGNAPISYEKKNLERCLAMHFIASINTGNLEQILDSRVIDAEVVGQMREVAMLAKRCLSMSGENRPQMIEVAMELEGLRRGKSHPWVSHNSEERQSLLYESTVNSHDEEIMFTNERTDTFNTGERMSAFHIDNGR